MKAWYHSAMTLEVLEERIRNMECSMNGLFIGVNQTLVKGFKDMTDRQDHTNGKVSSLELWRALTIGFCCCLSMFVIPMAIYIFKQL